MIKLPIIIVNDFNTPPSIMDRMRLKIIRKMKDLNNTTNRLDLPGIYIEGFTPEQQNKHSS